jgi:hypothetical protein
MATTTRNLVASIGPKVLLHASELFDSRTSTIAAELLQNSRRAGATHIDITITSLATTGEKKDGCRVIINDNGAGIDNPDLLLTFGGSGWLEDMQTSETPAGMGFWVVAPFGVAVRSKNWVATIPKEAFGHDGVGTLTEVDESIDGTTVSFEIDRRYEEVSSAFLRESEYFPVPVTINGSIVPQIDFLHDATAIIEIDGIRYGVFNRNVASIKYGQGDLNVHGHIVSARLPNLTEVAPLPHEHSRRSGREWVSRAQIIDAPALRLVLPTRDRVIEGPALENLRATALQAIYQTIARQADHRLSHADVMNARKLGIDMPFPKQLEIRRFWFRLPDETVVEHDNQTPFTIDPSATTAPANMLHFPLTENDEEEAQIGLALSEADLPFDIVRTDYNFDGYPGFDAIPTACASFEIRQGDKTVTINEPNDADKVDGVLDAPDQLTLVDDITMTVGGPPDRPQAKINRNIFVNTGWDGGEESDVFVRRGVSPSVAADTYENVMYRHHENDDSDARDYFQQHWLERFRLLLLPAGEARARTVADAVINSVLHLLGATDARAAVTEIYLTVIDGKRSLTVTLDDGTVVTQ